MAKLAWGLICLMAFAAARPNHPDLLDDDVSGSRRERLTSAYNHDIIGFSHVVLIKIEE